MVFLIKKKKKKGMERADLLNANAEIFKVQGAALNKAANRDTLKVFFFFLSFSVRIIFLISRLSLSEILPTPTLGLPPTLLLI